MFTIKAVQTEKVIEWPLFIIFSLIFLLMVPNTFYMVTDLIHLNQFTFNFYLTLNLMEWIFFTYLLWCLLRTLLYDLNLFGIVLLYFSPMDKYYPCGCSHVSEWIRNIYRTFLTLSFRFLINQPFKIIENVVSSLSGKSLIFILLMVVLQATLFIFAKGVRHTQ